MPEISRFYGITIRIFFKDHNPPHFHAYYAGQEALINIKTGEVIAGKLPIKAGLLVEEWRSINEQEILSCWQSIIEEGKFKRIKGLE